MLLPNDVQAPDHLPLPPESLSRRRSRRWTIGGLALGVASLTALVLVSDARALLQVVSEIEAWRLVAPLLFTVASYLAMARSYQKIASAAGVSIGFADMAKITLVSTAANYLLSTGGLSGLAVRSYYFSQRHGVRWGSAVGISLAQTFLTNWVLLAFFLWGVSSLAFLDDPVAPSWIALLTLLGGALGATLAAVVLAASSRVRRAVFGLLVASVDRVARRFVSTAAGLRKRLSLFEEELHEAIDFLIERRWRMAVPFAYIVLDWFFMLLTLHAAFFSVGRVVPLHLVVIGFSAGVFISVVNLIPAGLGLMEGSMATVFAGLGVPLEVAVAAVVIFRAAYYLLPLALTGLLFPDLLRTARQAVAGGVPGLG
jgi:hypothetical protein